MSIPQTSAATQTPPIQASFPAFRFSLQAVKEATLAQALCSASARIHWLAASEPAAREYLQNVTVEHAAAARTVLLYAQAHQQDTLRAVMAWIDEGCPHTGKQEAAHG